ncbi:hypothetical protein EES40_04125 [Streptomyces sp. ADI93-02]|nr:hypothetical protein EES40_04125 [Streptomyces sp. ADI93-02]
MLLSRRAPMEACLARSGFPQCRMTDFRLWEMENEYTEFAVGSALLAGHATYGVVAALVCVAVL